MKKNKEYFVSTLVLGLRKHKVGHVIPVKFTPVIKELRVSVDILKIKTKYTQFELSFVESKIVKDQC